MTDSTLMAGEAALEKWEALAAGVREARFTTPIAVLTGEALELSHFVAQRWEARTDGEEPEPGMKSAIKRGLIDETIAQDLQELVVAVTQAHGRFRSLAEPVPEAPVARGEFVLSELRQCLEFLFDDGVSDEHDAELERLNASHNDKSSYDALAMSLEGFAFYANRFRAELAELPDFDPALLDEALVIANRLRSQPSIRQARAASDRQGQALALRNRLLTLLIERVKRTRRAARFVFRRFPEIARLAGSAYERRRRARYRARAGEKA